MNLDEMLLRSHPGEGVVARFPGVAIVAAPSGPPQEAVTDQLLALAETASASGPTPGRRLARQVVAVLATADPDDVPPLCLLAQADTGLVLILQGAMDAQVTGPQGSEHLSGATVATWVDRILPPPIDALVVGPTGRQLPSPNPRSRLVAGVVSGSGLSMGPPPVVPTVAAAEAGPVAAAPVATAPGPAGGVASAPPPGVATSNEPAAAPPPVAAPPYVPDGPAVAAPAAPYAPPPVPAPAAYAPPAVAAPYAPPPGSPPVPQYAPAAPPAPAGPEWPAQPAAEVPAPPAAGAPDPALAAGQQEATALASAAPPPASVGEQPAPVEPKPFVSVALLAPEPDEVRSPLPIAGKEAPVQPDPAVPKVRGVICSRGHFNDPAAPFCGVCGISMVQRTLNLVEGPRPPLGVIVFDDGTTFTLDSDYVIGREPDNDPSVVSGSARPLTIEDPDRTVSRVHAGLIIDGWTVKAVDRGSANGTFLAGPGEDDWVPLIPNRPTAIKPGTRVRLGQRILLFDSHQGVR